MRFRRRAGGYAATVAPVPVWAYIALQRAGSFRRYAEMLGAARRLRVCVLKPWCTTGTARTLGIHKLARQAAKAGLAHEIAWVKQPAPKGAQDC